MKLSDEDRATLLYFYEEKGDMTRWVRWDEVRPLIAAEYPEILDALDRLTSAQRTLDACVARLR